MNFRLLNRTQIQEFLTLNSQYINLQTEDPYHQAQSLFAYLVQINATTFTEPIIDLYVATKLESETNQMYHYLDIIENKNLNEFADIMGLPSPNLNRILRVLKFMGLLYPPTLREVIELLSLSQISYEIMTGYQIDEEHTLDQLHRHEIEGFPGRPEGFKIRSNYLIFRLGFENIWNNLEDEELDVLYQSEEMVQLMTDSGLEDLISSYGKFIFPLQFTESIDYIPVPPSDAYFESEQVVFKFDQIIPEEFEEFIQLVQ